MRQTAAAHAPQNKNPAKTIQNLRNIVHHDINIWNNSLCCSGGYLNGEKSSYTIMSW